MSPNPWTGEQARACFPRVSGDEPSKTPYTGLVGAFSPRERG